MVMKDPAPSIIAATVKVLVMVVSPGLVKDVSDCCNSPSDDDVCVLKTGYCWDLDNGNPDSGLVVVPQLMSVRKPCMFEWGVSLG